MTQPLRIGTYTSPDQIRSPREQSREMRATPWDRKESWPRSIVATVGIAIFIAALLMVSV